MIGETGTGAKSLEHRIGSDGLFVLRLDDGDARIDGVDGDRVTIRAKGSRSLDRLAIERGEASLTVVAAHRVDGRSGSGGADLAIEVPSSATVIVEAGSADLITRHLSGDVRLTTSSGDLTILDAGGTLQAEAVSGDIQIVAPGTLDVGARTVSGDLDLRADSLTALRATTTSGDLTIAGRFAGDGPFLIETVSGDTSLEEPGDVRIEATTLTGDIHGRGIGRRTSRDRGPIVIGAATGPTVVFRSTSGDLHVTATPELVRPRPGSIDPGQPAVADRHLETPSPADEPSIDAAPDPSLDILRALERGEIDVAEAGRRLTAIESGDRIDPEATDA